VCKDAIILSKWRGMIVKEESKIQMRSSLLLDSTTPKWEREGKSTFLNHSDIWGWCRKLQENKRQLRIEDKSRNRINKPRMRVRHTATFPTDASFVTINL
jgi:hypothetical protein